MQHLQLTNDLPHQNLKCHGEHFLLDTWPTKPCIDFLQCIFHHCPLQNFADKFWLRYESKTLIYVIIWFKHDVPCIVRSEALRSHLPPNILRRQQNCWSLRCSWSTAYQRCSNYIFILNLTPGFNRLLKDNWKKRQETFKLNIWYN